MNRRAVYIVVLLLLACFSRAGWAVRSSRGSATVPPSSRRSGLIRSPNPIDTSGNLVITGNVGRGRHFRGVVPYRAPTDFGGALPSSGLDSFIRDSAGAEDYRGYTGGVRPYYSRTRTVTTTEAGMRRVFRGPADGVVRRVDETPYVPPAPAQQYVSRSEKVRYFGRLRPMGMTAEQMEKVIESELGTYLGQPKLTARRRWREVEELKKELELLGDKAGEMKKSLAEGGDIVGLGGEEKPQLKQAERYEAPRRKAQEGEEAGEEARMFGLPGKELDVYEQMKWRLYGLEKGLVPSAEAEKGEEAEETEKVVERREAREGAGGGGSVGEAAEEGRRTTQYEWRELTDAEMEARAREILGPHETFAAFADDKFNRHLRAAEQYLKEGKYYRAADAYTLASIYKPEDPLAYAGKSHALFAAGEYMSSALFLARALEIFPDYARFKIDIVAMVGDRDKLETRVADVEQWWKTSNSAELQFLLAYVYYQMGRVERAREAIDNAYENMPESAAVGALKGAIETGGR